MLDIENGEATDARRVIEGSNIRWEITLEPSDNDDIVVVLPVTTVCSSRDLTRSFHNENKMVEVNWDVTQRHRGDEVEHRKRDEQKKYLNSDASQTFFSRETTRPGPYTTTCEAGWMHSFPENVQGDERRRDSEDTQKRGPAKAGSLFFLR